MPNPSEPTLPNIDLKDEIVHLRTIHFSLLVACLVLLGLTLPGPSEDYEVAVEQLNEIQSAMDSLALDWLEGAAAKKTGRSNSGVGVDLFLPCDGCTENLGKLPFQFFDQSGVIEGFRLKLMNDFTLLPLSDGVLTIHSRTAHKKFEPMDKEGPLWSRAGKVHRRDPQFITPVPDVFPVDYDILKLPPPKNLSQMWDFWNALAGLTVNVAVVTDLPTNTNWVSFGFGDNRQVHFLAEASGAGWPIVELRLEPMGSYQRGLWRDRTEHQLRPNYHYVGHTPWGEINVPVEAVEAPLRVLPVLIDQTNKDWSHESFAVNFPELTALALDFSDRDFDQIRAILQITANQIQNEVAVFGLSIPAVVVAKWGGPILVIIQIYFLLHLSQFRDRIRNGGVVKTAPWIAIYPDPLSKAATVVSAVMFAPLTLAVVVFGDVVQEPILGVAVLASVGLAFFTIFVLREIWPRLGEHGKGGTQNAD